MNSWSGSIEIGVTVCEPSNLNFPFSATGFRDGTWVMSGMSILCDGHSMVEDYGCDLDQLSEGDRVSRAEPPVIYITVHTNYFKDVFCVNICIIDQSNEVIFFNNL